MNGIRLRQALGLLLVLSCAGCQAWHTPTNSAILGLASGERQIVKQAKNDPFPTPAEVGMKLGPTGP